MTKGQPGSGGINIQKAIFDYGVTILLIIPAFLLMAIIAVAIKVDSPGPVLFRQRRHGLNHAVFEVIKFRTMTVMEEACDSKHTDLNDQRVTRVGKFLRRAGLDELPQLINVLKGEMSLIGPRPHAIAHNHEFQTIINGYDNRHKVKPGISGWAQVNGLRGSAETLSRMTARIEYDLYYIDNWSMALDFKILFMTVILMLRSLFGISNQ
jgi:putative colanic acid biosynthesis UDP-glucose lipid carrier transferase